MLYSDKELKSQLNKIESKLVNYLKTLRTGRANPELFESLSVEYYGSHVELKTIANVIIDGALSVIIQPYDKSAVDNIELAIQKADMGLTPVNEGDKVRINIPPLTGERRTQIVDQMNLELENQFRKRVRQIRQDFNQKLDRMEGVSEDQIKSSRKGIQDLVDQTIENIDKLADKKAKDIMEIS